MDLSRTERILNTMQRFQKMGMSSKFIGEIPRSEIMMLKLIKFKTTETECVTISTLSEHLTISKPAVSQMINVLENKGYVERITTKEDRRVVYVKLTKAGQECLDKALQLLLNKLSIIFEKFGEQDTEMLIGLLDKLLVIVSEHKI